MLKNPSAQCYADTWKQNVLPYVIPLGFLYALILPAGVSILLFSNRKNLNFARFEGRFGFLTSSYRQEVLLVRTRGDSQESCFCISSGVSWSFLFHEAFQLCRNLGNFPNPLSELSAAQAPLLKPIISTVRLHSILGVFC